jgi:hypothetical protein
MTSCTLALFAVSCFALGCGDSSSDAGGNATDGATSQAEAGPADAGSADAEPPGSNASDAQVTNDAAPVANDAATVGTDSGESTPNVYPDGTVGGAWGWTAPQANVPGLSALPSIRNRFRLRTTTALVRRTSRTAS